MVTTGFQPRNIWFRSLSSLSYTSGSQSVVWGPLLVAHEVKTAFLILLICLLSFLFSCPQKQFSRGYRVYDLTTDNALGIYEVWLSSIKSDIKETYKNAKIISLLTKITLQNTLLIMKMLFTLTCNAFGFLKNEFIFYSKHSTFFVYWDIYNEMQKS